MDQRNRNSSKDIRDSVLSKLRHRVELWFTAARFAVILLVIASIFGLLGYLHRYNGLHMGTILDNIVDDFYANIVTDAISIAITVLIIDNLNQKRNDQQLKSQLIREIKSPDNGMALRAFQELEAHGWTQDGSLKKTDLRNANLQGLNMDKIDLQGSNMSGANLQGARLWGCNLQDVNFTQANLQGANLLGTRMDRATLLSASLRNSRIHHVSLVEAKCWNVDLENANLFDTNLKRTNLTDQLLIRASCLSHSIMPDGSKYNGRLRLKHDYNDFQVDPNSPKAMAEWFAISLEEYRNGQIWADNNLSQLLEDAKRKKS